MHFNQLCSILLLLDLRAPHMHNSAHTLGVCVVGGGGEVCMGVGGGVVICTSLFFNRTNPF